MRTFAMLAFFVLAVATIVEGAVIVRLSHRFDALAARRPGLEAAPEPTRHDIGGGSLPAAGRGVAVVRAAPPALPRLLSAPADDESRSAPATAVLREALASGEGREHLKAALEILREQDKQEKMVGRAERAITREQQHVQRLTQVLTLSSDEQNKVGQLYATLQSNRRRVLDDMRAGQKDSGQADDEIDKLRDETEASVRALLGEPRMRQFREANQRRRDRGSNGADNNPQPGAAPGAAAAPAP